MHSVNNGERISSTRRESERTMELDHSSNHAAAVSRGVIMLDRNVNVFGDGDVV